MKRLVVCCDGTWNKPDEEKGGYPVPTNVVKLAYRIAKRGDNGIPQIVFYELGVGTGNFFDRIAGGVLGKGLSENILDAYRFLMANYEPGDELFLFGFSRGAFTARSIAGMIRKCGILRRGAVERYSEAKALYHNQAHPDAPESVEFRKRYSVTSDAPIPIQFIGVWDTVGSLGIPMNGGVASQYQFHDTELSGTVERACHALAIDEHRAPFLPTLWQYLPKPAQRVEQVWFCGAHSDVGGGYPEDDASQIPLQWMLERAADAGLRLDEEAVQAYPVRYNSLGELHDSRTLLYALRKRVEREIGHTADGRVDSTQSVHPSVLERWDGDPRYRPPNLRRYLQRVNDSRARG